MSLMAGKPFHPLQIWKKLQLNLIKLSHSCGKETKLREEGAKSLAKVKSGPHIHVDGKLVTRQNPASSEGPATAVIQLLKGL